MSGSKGARASPDLIAACHVFHRLSMPRHPSEALMRLIVLSKTHVWGRIIRPGRTKDLDAPTHALCFLMSSRARPSSSIGEAGLTLQFTMSFCQYTRLSQGDWKLVSAIAQMPSWWSQSGSNRRPHACKARALPTELWPQS